MGRSRSRSRGGGRGEEDRIQRLVDERQQCRRDRDFDRADRLRDELRDMGVQVDDSALSWRGSGGLEGIVNNGGGRPGAGGPIERRDGDWDCPRCGKMVFASKSECFACGEPKPSGGGGGRGRSYDRGGGGRGGYDDRDDRRGGGGRYDDRYGYDDRDDRRGGGGRGGDRYDDYDDRRRRRRDDSYDDYDRGRDRRRR